MSDQTLALLSALRARLRATARRMTLARWLRLLALYVGALAAAALLLVGIEAGFWTSSTARMILVFGIVVPLALVCTVHLGMLLLRLAGLLPGIPDTQVARAVGQDFPEISDRLSNMLDLSEGRVSLAPPPLVDGAVRMLAEQVMPIRFERSADFSPARKALRWAVIPLAGLLLFAVAAPSAFTGASLRLMSPGTHYVPPAPFALSVEPGFGRVIRGEPLRLSARLSGTSFAETATLYMHRSGEVNAESVPLHLLEGSTFMHDIPSVRNAFRYMFEAGPVHSPWYDIEVTERPVVRGLRVELRPPAYAKLPSQQLPPNSGDVTALAGTQVSVLVQTGAEEVAVAYLRFSESDSVALQPGDPLAGTFTLRMPETYHIILENTDGVRNADPIPYSLDVIPDLYPAVEIVHPASDANLDPSLIAPLRLRLNDDFGFSGLKLRWRLAESRFSDIMAEFVAVDLVPAPELDQLMMLDWDLAQSTGLDIVPGDAIEFYAEVFDNDAVSGFKSARSGTRLLSLPSLAERYAALDETQTEAESEMESLLRETEEIRERFEELRDELRRDPQSDWEDARQLENLQQEQRRLEERLEELGDRLEAAAGQMEDHELVSEETVELFREVQRVVEEIHSPELMEALEALQQALEQMDPRQMQEAMEGFEFSEEMFRQRLERALELFKRFQLQRELEEAARRSEDIANTQESLAEETEHADADQKREELAEEQLQSREDMLGLEASLADIAERMEELSRAPQQEMQQLYNETKGQELPQQMQANAQQMQQGQMQQANAGQRHMQQQMQSLQADLQNMQSSMQGRQLQINSAGLRRVLRDVLTLSHDQEDVRLALADVPADSPAMRELARRQQALSEGLSTVADSLQSLAREIPQLTRQVQRLAGESLGAMDDATAALVEQRGTQAVTSQKISMTRLNELAILLSDLLEQLMNAASSASSSGMSMEQMTEQLQQMARQQAQLNEQIQQMLNEAQGQRLVADYQERLRQLGMQQQMMQRQLREMNRDRDLAQQLLGDLERIAESMEESIQEMARGSISQRTQQRQQEILTRLLDASRSMQERGRERRREGERGQDIERESPPGADPAEEAARLRRALLEALERGYAPDYEELIKRYFLLLQDADG